MNVQKVVFAFFVLLALSLNFGFFVGQIDNPLHHSVYELFGAIVVSLIATVLKFGERSQIGALVLAGSLVADVGLLAGACIWGYVEHIGTGMTPGAMAMIVSLAGGALIANIVSVMLMIIEGVTVRR